MQERKPGKNFKIKKVTIFGVIPSFAFQRAKYCAIDLHRKLPQKFPLPEIIGLVELDWSEKLSEWRQTFGREYWCLRRPVAVFFNDRFIGSDIELLKLASMGNILIENVPLKNSCFLKDEARKDYISYLKDTKRIYCYLDLCVDEVYIGTLTFELYNDILPRTCENFKTLCLGTRGPLLSYRGSRIHRIVKKGWLQGGDIQYKTGGGGFSIFCDPLEDECFAISHNRRGVLSMANGGRHQNGSQFFITLNPTKWMDDHFVAFGQLIEGVSVLKKLEKIETMYECPLEKIEIKNCGKLDLSDVEDIDAMYKEEPLPTKKQKKIETITQQIVRLIMEALTDALARKEYSPDILDDGDIPSKMNLHLYFQGFYSISEEIMEQSAQYFRELKRKLLRVSKPSATEVVEVIMYDLLMAVLSRMVNLDDVRETMGYNLYEKMIKEINLEIQTCLKSDIAKLIDQIVSTAETMVNLVNRKLMRMKKASEKIKMFQESMTNWVQSFVIQETFKGDCYHIARRANWTLAKIREEEGKILFLAENECCALPPEEVKEKENPCKRVLKEKSLTDRDKELSNYFRTCWYNIKRGPREETVRMPLLDLIEMSRLKLRCVRKSAEKVKPKERICLEKKINQWMDEVVYTPETSWIRGMVFEKGDVVCKHVDEIMYGAMTAGLLEMYYFVEQYLKRCGGKKKKLVTRVIYPHEMTSDDDMKERKAKKKKKKKKRKKVKKSKSKSQSEIQEGSSLLEEEVESLTEIQGESEEKKPESYKPSVPDEKEEIIKPRMAVKEKEKKELGRKESEKKVPERTESEKIEPEKIEPERIEQERKVSERRGSEKKEWGKKKRGSRPSEPKAKPLPPCPCGHPCCVCKFDPHYKDTQDVQTRRGSITSFSGSNTVLRHSTLSNRVSNITKSVSLSIARRGGEPSDETLFSNASKVPSVAKDPLHPPCKDSIHPITLDPKEVHIKSFMWLEPYIREKGCDLKSQFASQVHEWLDGEEFNYGKFFSKHSLVTKASLLSLSLSLAALLKEDNQLKAGIKDFIYDLWLLYFDEMFKEALLEFPSEVGGPCDPEGQKKDVEVDEMDNFCKELPKEEPTDYDFCAELEKKEEEEPEERKLEVKEKEIADLGQGQESKVTISKSLKSLAERVESILSQSTSGSRAYDDESLDENITEKKEEANEEIKDELRKEKSVEDQKQRIEKKKSVQIKSKESLEELVEVGEKKSLEGHKLEEKKSMESERLLGEKKSILSQKIPAEKKKSIISERPLESKKSVQIEEVKSYYDLDEPKLSATSVVKRKSRTSELSNLSSAQDKSVSLSLLSNFESSESIVKSREKITRKKSGIVVWECVDASSEDSREMPPYVLPFWVEFLTQLTKQVLGALAKVSRLPRRLYFLSDSVINFDDKMKDWLEFNAFNPQPTKGREITDYFLLHEKPIKTLDESARSYLKKKKYSGLINRCTRIMSAEDMAGEIVAEVVETAVEKNETSETSQMVASLLSTAMGASTLEKNESNLEENNTDSESSTAAITEEPL